MFCLVIILYCKLYTVQPARNLHLNTRHRDLPQRVRWKWPPRSVFFADISCGHRCSIAHGSEQREGHDHQGQRVFGRGVRPRVDNSDHRGQRVYEGSALAVLYMVGLYITCTLFHFLCCYCSNKFVFVLVGLRPSVCTD